MAYVERRATQLLVLHMERNFEAACGVPHLDACLGQQTHDPVDTQT